MSLAGVSYKDFWKIENDMDAHLKVMGALLEKNVDCFNAHQAANFILNEIRYPNELECLEIGAGYGRVMKAIKPFIKSVVGVDVSEDLIRRSGGEPIVLTDGEHLPFTDSSFDLVYSYLCFQHMPNIRIVRQNLSEVYRVLCSGGVFKGQFIQGDAIDYGEDNRYGNGRNFPSALDLQEEFKMLEFSDIEVRLGISHPQHTWVTARK